MRFGFLLCIVRRKQICEAMVPLSKEAVVVTTETAKEGVATLNCFPRSPRVFHAVQQTKHYECIFNSQLVFWFKTLARVSFDSRGPLPVDPSPYTTLCGGSCGHPTHGHPTQASHTLRCWRFFYMRQFLPFSAISCGGPAWKMVIPFELVTLSADSLNFRSVGFRPCLQHSHNYAYK